MTKRHIARANRIVESGSIIVDVYSGFTPGRGGAPFGALVGSFVAESVNFATQYSYAWRPFGLAAFGAEIRGVLNVASDGLYTFALDSGPGETAWRGSNKPKPVCNGSDMPTSIGSLFARESAESFSRRKCK